MLCQQKLLKTSEFTYPLIYTQVLNQLILPLTSAEVRQISLQFKVHSVSFLMKSTTNQCISILQNLIPFKIACSQQKLYLYNQALKQMNSNQQLSNTQALYLKQFFGNYFERKQHTQTISALANGLTVIQSLITHFQKYLQSHPQEYQQRGEKDLNQMVQDIYNRLSHIFETIRREKESEIDGLWSSRKQMILQNSIQDQELYEILNKYKNDFKKQKEQRIKLQKEIDTLKDTLHNLRAERDRITQKANSYEKVAQRVKNENKHLQGTISSLKEQIEHLENYKQQTQIKLEEIVHLELAHNEIRKQHELVLLKYEQSQQQKALLQEKFKHLDGIVESKIQRNQAKWTKQIEEKLNNTEIYQKTACRAFKQFLKSFNKENNINIS